MGLTRREGAVMLGIVVVMVVALALDSAGMAVVACVGGMAALGWARGWRR